MLLSATAAGGQEASKSTVNDEIQWILRELAPCVADLTENLQQLGGAVQMMESKKGTFKVDPTELAKRKEWLQVCVLGVPSARPPARATGGVLGGLRWWRPPQLSYCGVLKPAAF